jgi:hypothetical protein
MATSLPGVFAAGNLVHAAETADVAALSGRHAARQICSFLAGQRSPATARRVPVVPEAPLLWVSPNIVTPSGPIPPQDRFVLRTGEFRRPARLTARQDGQVLARSRPQRIIPGRPLHLPASWLTTVDPDGGPIHVTIEPAN